MPVKAKISEFVKDYCNGVSDRELLAKYGITPKETIQLVKKLIGQGTISKEQYFERTRKIEEAKAREEKAFLKSLYHCPVCSHIQPTPFTVCPACGTEISQTDAAQGEPDGTSAPPASDVPDVELPVPSSQTPSADQPSTSQTLPIVQPKEISEALRDLVGTLLTHVTVVATGREDVSASDYYITDVTYADNLGAMFKADAGAGSGPSLGVRFVDPELVADADLDSVMRRIVEYQSAMEDRNVLRILGSAKLDGRPAILYEHVPLTLDMLIEREPEGLSLELILDLLPQMLNGLGYSHMHRGKNGLARRLPHMHLKASSFLFDPDRKVVKLEGCGFWRSLVDERGHKKRLWEEPGIDLAGLPPEAFVLESKFVNPFRADIYALGAVIYRLCTGTPAFSGADAKEYGFAHLRKFPVPPRVHRYTLPAWLDGMILKCLEKDPPRRWRSATQMELSIGKELIQ